VVERDVVLAKVATIDRCLSRILEVRARRAQLLPLDVEDLVLLNLQRAAQAAIDLASHVTTTEGYGLPDSVAGTFTLLEQNGVIDPDLGVRMRKMAGFRNIAVHAYQAIDPAVVEAIVANHLDDLRRFAAAIVARFGVVA
jgi:uncharacterized protein YutE (UPF0331/DUF86 family)